MSPKTPGKKTCKLQIIRKLRLPSLNSLLPKFNDNGLCIARSEKQVPLTLHYEVGQPLSQANAWSIEEKERVILKAVRLRRMERVVTI